MCQIPFGGEHFAAISFRYSTVSVLIVAMGQGGCHAQQIEKNYSPSKRIKRRSNFVRLLKIIFFVVGYHVVIFPQNHCFLTHAEQIKKIIHPQRIKRRSNFVRLLKNCYGVPLGSIFFSICCAWVKKRLILMENHRMVPHNEKKFKQPH